MVSEGFNILFEYASASRRFAGGLPQQKEVFEYWTGVGFNLGNKSFVIPINEVTEILSMPKFTIVPGVKPWVKGIANIRGRLLPVVDLVIFFTNMMNKKARRRRLLVLEKDEIYSGILVDDVLGMQHFPVQNYRSTVDASLEKNLQAHLLGTYWRTIGTQRSSEGQDEEEVTEEWPIFSLHRLADNPTFMQVAVEGHQS